MRSLLDWLQLAVFDVSVHFTQLEFRNSKHGLLLFQLDLELLRLLLQRFGLILNLFQLIPLVEVLRLKVIPQLLLFLFILNWWQAVFPAVIVNSELLSFFLKGNKFILVLFILILNLPHLLGLPLLGLLILLETGLQLLILVPLDAQVLHQLLDLLLVVLAGGYLVQNDALLLVFLLQLFDFTLVLFLLFQCVCQHLLEFGYVFSSLKLTDPALKLIDLPLIVFDLFLTVLDLFVTDGDQVRCVHLVLLFALCKRQLLLICFLDCPFDHVVQFLDLVAQFAIDVLQFIQLVTA